jgi:hypothetical protein
MFAPDDGAWHWADYFERHGGRDQHWRRILQRPGLRRLARIGAQTDLDGRPHDPISRCGNRYLRALFVQAAWVVLVRIKNWERYGLKSWIEAAKRRLHHNMLAIARVNTASQTCIVAKLRPVPC